MTLHYDWFGAEALGASGAGRPTAHDVATRMLAFSAARGAAFAAFDLAINDIAWEMLLGLFVAQERGRRLDVAVLCDMIDQPRVVSIRWLRALRASGLVEYDDGERMSGDVRLTAAAAAALRGLIDADEVRCGRHCARSGHADPLRHRPGIESPWPPWRAAAGSLRGDRGDRRGARRRADPDDRAARPLDPPLRQRRGGDRQRETPPELLARLKRIERRFGRRPGRRWGSRVIDLDIVLWSGGRWSSRDLTVPHASFRERRFVLDCLVRLVPDWRDPLTHRTVRQLAHRARG